MSLAAQREPLVCPGACFGAYVEGASVGCPSGSRIVPRPAGGELMDLLWHLIHHHRMTWPYLGELALMVEWRAGGLWRPVKPHLSKLWKMETCLGHEDSVWLSILSWLLSFKGGRWSREKNEKNSEQRLILVTGWEPQIISADSSLC